MSVVMRNNQMTIIGLAELCGFSKTTVACALNPSTAHKVAPTTRKKILSMCKEVGYIPNVAARVLRSRKTMTIGVLLPEPGNSLHASIMMNLQRKLSQRGYSALFSFWETYADDADAIQRTLDMLVARGVDGIIIGHIPMVRLQDKSIPVVSFGNMSNLDSYSSFPTAGLAYSQLIDLFFERGCKSFGVISQSVSVGRPEIIRELLAKRGYDIPEEFLVDGISSPEKVRPPIQAMVESGRYPDVFFANNDYLAMAAMSEAIRLGVKVPGQMKFVGFDDIPESAYLHPTLTTFHISAEDIAERLLALLFRRMQQPDAEILSESLMPKLILREST